MTRTEVLQEIRRMRFKEAYGVESVAVRLRSTPPRFATPLHAMGQVRRRIRVLGARDDCYRTATPCAMWQAARWPSVSSMSSGSTRLQ